MEMRAVSKMEREEIAFFSLQIDGNDWPAAV